MLRFLLWVAAEEFGLRPVQFCLQRPGVSDTLSIPLLGEPRYFEDPLCVYVRKNGVKATGRIKVRRFQVRSMTSPSYLSQESGKRCRTLMAVSSQRGLSQTFYSHDVVE
jgi:hypothetical protein